MIIKVSGISFTAQYYNQRNPQPKTHYYQPQTPKEEVKKDFGLLLDAEIKSLKFEKFV